MTKLKTESNAKNGRKYLGFTLFFFVFLICATIILPEVCEERSVVSYVNERDSSIFNEEKKFLNFSEWKSIVDVHFQEYANCQESMTSTTRDDMNSCDTTLGSQWLQFIDDLELSKELSQDQVKELKDYWQHKQDISLKAVFPVHEENKIKRHSNKYK